MGHIIGKVFEFHAAHYLPNYEGNCKSLHGHGYKMEVLIKGKVNATSGMIMDFKKLKEIVERIILDPLDHTLLNNVFENPTAEIMVASIYYSLKKEIPDIWAVKLWETSTSYAMFSEVTG